MEQKNMQINPLDMNKVAEIAGHTAEQLRDILVNILPTMGQIKGAEGFHREMMEKISDKLTVTLLSLAPLRQREPTRFEIELRRHILTASEEVKRELVSSHKLVFDVEEDIRKVRADMESFLNTRYKSEMSLWKMMQEERWEDAMQIIRAIELERESGDDILDKVEVANWKQYVSAHRGDADTYFVSLSGFLEAVPKEAVAMYDPTSFDQSLGILLSKILRTFNIQLNPLGYQKVVCQNFLIVTQEIGSAFCQYLVREITNATFKDRSINSGEDFRSLLRDDAKRFEKVFVSLNPYVNAINYTVPNH